MYVCMRSLRLDEKENQHVQNKRVLKKEQQMRRPSYNNKSSRAMKKEQKFEIKNYTPVRQPTTTYS